MSEIKALRERVIELGRETEGMSELLSFIMRERLKEADEHKAFREQVMAVVAHVDGGLDAMMAEGARQEERRLERDTEACGCGGAPECQRHYR